MIWSWPSSAVDRDWISDRSTVLMGSSSLSSGSLFTHGSITSGSAISAASELSVGVGQSEERRARVGTPAAEAACPGAQSTCREGSMRWGGEPQSGGRPRLKHSVSKSVMVRGWS